MSMKGYSILTPEQEAELEDQLTELWVMEDEKGDPKYTGKKIAKALGFGGVAVLPDGSLNPYHLLEADRVYHYRHKFGLPKRHNHRRYPHRYKYGKQDEILDLDEMIKKVDAIDTGSFHGK